MEQPQKKLNDLPETVNDSIKFSDFKNKNNKLYTNQY